MKIHREYSDALEFFAESLREIARNLLAREQGEASGIGDKSGTASHVQMSFKEMQSRVTVYILGGYDTIAATLTWALIELSRNPDIQNTLRNELQEHIPTSEGLTYDKLMNGLPYLDALVSETLRLHLSVDLKRQVNEDDTIPLGQPIVTPSGALIDSLPVAKGTIIRMPIAALNRSEALWGPDATTFDPTRWLEKRGEVYKRREEIPGYPHLLTFGYGPRVCIGKTFALAEIKASTHLPSPLPRAAQQAPFKTWAYTRDPSPSSRTVRKRKDSPHPSWELLPSLREGFHRMGVVEGHGLMH